MLNHQTNQQHESFNTFLSNAGPTFSSAINEAAKQKYLEEEKKRLLQFEEQRQKQLEQQSHCNFLRIKL